MTHPQLDNLVRIGHLKTEPAAEGDILGLLRSGQRRLDNAERTDLFLESRFDLGCNAAHAIALAALRAQGSEISASGNNTGKFNPLRCALATCLNVTCPDV